jgi:DNA-binding beta-propeller fold protein YncE
MARKKKAPLEPVRSPLSQLLRRLAPLGLVLACAFPAHGQLYVMSRQTQQVLAYDESDGSFQEEFAETVTMGFRVPVGISLRPSDGVLYVSSVSTGEIWSYTTANGEPIPPAVSSDPFAPGGIDFDASGSFLYFADASTVESETSDEVKRLDIGSGVVTTVGTNNQADFLAVAVNGSDVFATDIDQHRIIRFPSSGGKGTVVVSTNLASPAALLFPTATQMLVADAGNDRVVEYLESGGVWSPGREVLPASAGLDDPGGLALAPDGRLTVSGRQSGNVVLVDLTTLAVTPLVSPGTGGLTDPAGLAWSGNTLLVASPSGNAVLYFDSSGQPTGVRAEGLSASLDSGIHLSSDGSRLYAASFGSNDVLEYDAASGARLRIFNAVCPNLPSPFDVATGADDRLYVSCILNNSIERFDLTSGASLGSFVLGGSGGLVSPRGLRFGENGNLFVANGTGEVIQFDAVTGAPVAPIPFVDANGNGGGPLDAYNLSFRGGVLYVASFLHDEVMAFDASSGAYLSTFVGAGSGGLDGPRSLAFGTDGDLYVTSENGDTILRYDGATGAFAGVFVSVGSGGLDGPFDLVFGSATAISVPASQPGARAALFALLLAAAARFARGRRAAWEDET